MITSLNNPTIKNIRLLQRSSRARKKQRLFVIEGVRLIEDALNSGLVFNLVLFIDDLTIRGRVLIDELEYQGLRIEQISTQVLLSISDTKTPQGILAVAPIPEIHHPEILDLILILDAIRDPGNLGTILRTAGASAVQAVFISPDSVDPYSPKVVRAGMGAHFSLPIYQQEISQICELKNRRGLKIILADSTEGIEYTKIDLKQPVGLIIGGEAEGAGEASKQIADEYIHIPMTGGTESLNAAVSTGIILFEIVRQRRE